MPSMTRLVPALLAAAAILAEGVLKLETAESTEWIEFGPIHLQRDDSDRLASSGTLVAPEFACASATHVGLCEENAALRVQIGALNSTLSSENLALRAQLHALNATLASLTTAITAPSAPSSGGFGRKQHRAQWWRGRWGGTRAER